VPHLAFHRLPEGQRKLPPLASRSPGPHHAVDLSEPVTPGFTVRPSHHIAPHSRATGGINAVPEHRTRLAIQGRPGQAERLQEGGTKLRRPSNPAGSGLHVGAGVRSGVGVGVGLDTDPHTDLTVRLSTQVNRHPATVVVYCDRPSSGVFPGGDAYPYEL
jgi:hypothetical protein